jgi:hypothetical protein
MKHLYLLTFCAAVCISNSAIAAEHHTDLSKIDTSKLPPASNKADVTFAKDIQPLLKESCIRCHGENRPKGGLRLDSREGILKGSHDGKVVQPGKSKDSLIVIAAARIDDETAMPPKRGAGKGGGRPGGAPQAGGTNNPAGKPSGGAGGPGNFPPPKPLTSEQVGLLRAWIDQGAK